MSVPEMRKLLGLKKTDSYWLVHKNFFKTEVIGGMMRIDLVSFEKWYANQVKYKKVDGEEPGKELREKSYSFKEAANILGIHDCDLYDISYSGNKSVIKRFKKIARDLYCYYGVSEEDIKNRTKRYSSLVTELSS